MSRRFVFTVCQPGAEAALKQEVARRHTDWRFAFSRPGFVTFRLPNAANPEPRSTFARTWGISIGKIRSDGEGERASEAWQLIDAHAEPTPPRHLHVYARERVLPGDLGFDAAVAAQERSVGERLLALRPGGGLALNEVAARGEHVLDCVLVEPNEWWLGRHVAASPETRWPGGAPLIAVPLDMISRAYLKLNEALAWSELPVHAGDAVVEIGSAPGGAAQALLERGCAVTGIDPAEMDSRVLANPRFTHLRARAKDVKRSAFAGFRWLVSDANVAPNYTLDTVEAIVTHPAVAIEGLVLTIKLTNAAYTAKLPQYVERVRSFGYAHVRARQLAYNRQEVCVVATARSKRAAA